MVSETTAHRRAFWLYLADRMPALAARMTRGNEHSRWLAVGPRPLVLAHFIAGGAVGLFVRGAAREPVGPVRDFLLPHREMLTRLLGHANLGTTFLLADSVRLDMNDRANWPEAADWFGDRSPVYESALAAIQQVHGNWLDEFIRDAEG